MLSLQGVVRVETLPLNRWWLHQQLVKEPAIKKKGIHQVLFWMSNCQKILLSKFELRMDMHPQ